MSFINDRLGLSEKSVNILSVGIAVFFMCLGIKIIKAANFSLSVANAQFVTRNSASTLEELAEKLNSQAEAIAAKDAAYKELLAVYNQSLRGRQGYNRLQQAIEAVEATPEIEDVKAIKNKIEITEETLTKVKSDRNLYERGLIP